MLGRFDRDRGVRHTWHPHPRCFRGGEITGREANHVQGIDNQGVTRSR